MGRSSSKSGQLKTAEFCAPCFKLNGRYLLVCVIVRPLLCHHSYISSIISQVQIPLGLDLAILKALQCEQGVKAQTRKG